MGLGTCDDMLDIVCAGQADIDREKVLGHIGFSVDFDRVCHSRILYTSCVMWVVGEAVFNVFASFLTGIMKRV